MIVIHLQERQFENQETNFEILSIEFWTKHYQLDLGKMEICEYKPLSLYTRVLP